MSRSDPSRAGRRGLRLLPMVFVLLGLASLLRLARDGAACDGLAGAGLVLLALGWLPGDGPASVGGHRLRVALAAGGLLLMAVATVVLLRG